MEVDDALDYGRTLFVVCTGGNYWGCACRLLYGEITLVALGGLVVAIAAMLGTLFILMRWLGVAGGGG